ncbi:MAG: hypothetical protein C0601_01490 [Candidatus Muiribacterium halophilum]|uniref:Uncharacterized protein n=1 Tax=Muiribacterium halophilum TaxID=2053465 RepID=A0A2N5ZLL3_MUIH1|nr:MAG: hypothetical protein C0601_01490 [Candidatus Muirbacterium halophilum]
MKRIITSIILLMSFILVYSESTLTFPVSDQLEGNEKNLILKIVIPNELEDKEEYKEKKTDFSYFNLDPWPAVDKGKIDWERLNHLVKAGAIRYERTKYLVKNKKINDEYDMFLVLDDILTNIKNSSKDLLLENGMLREDIEYIEKLIFEDMKGYTKKAHVDPEALKKRLNFLKKQFLAGKGEVRVIKVETNNAGETMIHLRLNEED